jgi:hypothetical protein
MLVVKNKTRKTNMGLLEDEMKSEKILWIKKMVVKLDLCHPDDPQEQIQELKVTHYPEFGENGVFIKHMSTPRSDDDEPELGEVFIKTDAIPELIVTLQKYLSMAINGS